MIPEAAVEGAHRALYPLSNPSSWPEDELMDSMQTVREALEAAAPHMNQPRIDMAPEYTDEMTPLDIRRDELALEGWGISYYGTIASAQTRRFIDRIISLEGTSA